MKFEIGQLVYVDGGKSFWEVVGRRLNKQGIPLYWLESRPGTKQLIAVETQLSSV